jgi:uncharacterized membrane protein
MRIRLLLGLLLVLVGLVWIGQGIGLIGGSFMSDEVAWAVIGLLTLGIGMALVAWGIRRERSAG